MQLKSHLKGKDVLSIFETFKKDIASNIAGNNYERAAHLIENAAIWGYQYNFKYVDEELEKAIHIIADTLKVDSKKHDLNEQKIAFVCNRILDNAELVQQYARALGANNIPYLIIIINRKSLVGHSAILNELKNDKNAEIIFVEDNDDYVGTAHIIANYIREYNPSKILSHAWPWDIRIWLAIAALPSIPCYNICFNDHTFWIGASVLDYNIEFRPYGSTISIEKRGLKAEQLFHLPYYPILSKDIPFEGLPYDFKGKIVIFTGGTSYKMLGQENLFFQIMDRILDENDNSVVLLACGDSKPIKERIAGMKNSKRVFLTGFRRDIYALFEHSDLFLETYPCSGGLMSQYAATLGKPIIAYANKCIALEDTDGIVNYNNRVPISLTSVDEVCEYAKKLCTSKQFRESEGGKLQNAVITQKQFEDILGKILTNKEIPCRLEHLDIDYEAIREFYLCFNNHYRQGSLFVLLKSYRLMSFIKYPKYTFIFMFLLLKHAKKILLFRR